MVNVFVFCFVFFFLIERERKNIHIFKVPEDNVERLRNIRDMFENTAAQNDDSEIVLQKIERLTPAEKIKEKLTRLEKIL